jgi:hypothetical protein
MKRIRGFFSKSRNQDGTVILFVVGMLILLLGFAALALDVGHLLVVRNQLQNVADAAALSGASYLYPQDPYSSPYPPDWDVATTQATSAVALNRSEGVTLTGTGSTIQTGYWDIGLPMSGSGSVNTLKSTGITPGSTDCPAVRVTVTQNVRNWFAPVLGIGTSDVSAMATAVMASPGTAGPGALLPVAITREAAEQKSSYTCGSGSNFRIGSSYHYPSTEAGQWTSFFLDRNDVPTIRDLIANGNPDPISIGDEIWIQPGTETTLYSSVPIGGDFVLPIIENIVTHADVPVIGFVCFHVIDSVGGSDKYIEGCFNDACYAGGTSGVGPNFGAKAPPRLVQ